MRLNEINKPSKKAIFEGLKSDTEHTFSNQVLEEIAESVSNFNHNQPGMTVTEAIEYLESL